MYNLFQQNVEKVPKILKGTLHLFTFALQTVYGSDSTKKPYLAAAYHSG